MPRNILVIMSDDHAQWATGFAGNSEIQSPNLDHLARTGVVYPNAYTPSPVCSPSRASFFTGVLPSQHGVHDYLASGEADVASTPWLAGERFLGEILQEHGYMTGLSGKWHLGGDQSRQRGFDVWYSRGAPLPEAFSYEAPWDTDHPPEMAYDPHAITDHAVEFLRRRDAERPFFLFVGYVATHSPWAGQPERLVERFRSATFRDIPLDDVTYPFGRLRSESIYPSRATPREALAQYYAAVSAIDEQVGRLLDTLHALELDDDTAVLYTSDHGLNMGHHGIWGKGNGTLPYNVVDESIRVPLVVNAPGAMIGGQRREEPVTHLDTFATILELAGADAELADPRYPGRSYAGTLRSLPEAEPREHVFAEYGTLRMVRSRTRKLVVRTDGPDQLFDLEDDPRETRNVAGREEYAADLAELRRVLHDYFARYEDPVRRGTNVMALPRHNRDEAWRDDRPPVLEESADWIERVEAEIRARRTAAPHEAQA